MVIWGMGQGRAEGFGMPGLGQHAAGRDPQAFFFNAPLQVGQGLIRATGSEIFQRLLKGGWQGLPLRVKEGVECRQLAGKSTRARYTRGY